MGQPDARGTIEALRSAFAGRCHTDEAGMAPFLRDWRRRWQGRAIAVAQPDTAQDVARLVQWCAAHDVPVVPQGGNTGLSGGSVPDDSGRALVLSLTRLNRVRALDAANLTMTVEAGCTLAAVQAAASEAGLLFPLSLASEGSCTIGGNLATNAGGVAVLRYGSARALCLGLEAVTADGVLWDGLRGLRKDNTGYDLRDLFIGSEGTLGVITAAVLRLYPRPAERVAAYVAVPRVADALLLLRAAQEALGDGLTAFELISAGCQTLVLDQHPSLRRPAAFAADWYVLLDYSAAQAGQGQGAVLAVLEGALEAGWAADGAVAASVAQAASFWAIREAISDCQGALGPTIKHDIALPVSAVPDFLRAADAAVAAAFADVRLFVFGHLGDGNLHYNMSPRSRVEGGWDAQDDAGFLAREPAVNRLVHDLVMAHGGSISAEHGLGVLRRDEAARYKSTAELRLMRAVKAALDPAGLMNPGKMLP